MVANISRRGFLNPFSWKSKPSLEQIAKDERKEEKPHPEEGETTIAQKGGEGTMDYLLNPVTGAVGGALLVWKAGDGDRRSFLGAGLGAIAGALVGSVSGARKAYAKMSSDQKTLYKIAMTEAKRANRLWLEKKYQKAMPVYEQLILMFKRLPLDEVTGNYAAILTGYAGCLVHDTLEAYFKRGKAYKDSKSRLMKAKKLLEEAIKDYDYCFQKYPEEKKQRRKISSGTFNLLGLATKYLGNIREAKNFYEEALRRNPNNNDARYNLNHINQKVHVFK